MKRQYHQSIWNICGVLSTHILGYIACTVYTVAHRRSNRLISVQRVQRVMSGGTECRLDGHDSIISAVEIN